MLKVGVVIGRFAPVHTGHLDGPIKKAFEENDYVVIGVGSSNQQPDLRTPFQASERAFLLLLSVPQQDDIWDTVKLPDCPTNEMWAANVIEIVTENIEDNLLDPSMDYQVTLYGHDKDDTTFYLHLFPKWKLKLVGSSAPVSATQIRKAYYEGADQDWEHWVAPGAVAHLKALRTIPEIQNLIKQYHKENQ